MQMRLYLWILSRILPSYEADSPVSAYASVDASSDSALADTSVSLVAAASSDAESDYSYANSVGDLTYSASETMYSHAYLSIPIHHPSRDLRNYSASHPSMGL